MRTKSGRLVWLADRALIVRDESGKPVTSLGILQDITERKRLEAQLAELDEDGGCRQTGRRDRARLQ